MLITGVDLEPKFVAQPKYPVCVSKMETKAYNKEASK
jgi:hypothetical protein